MFSVSFFCVVSGSPDRVCRADSESVRKSLGLLFPRNDGLCDIQQCQDFSSVV